VWESCAQNHININEWIEGYKLDHDGKEPRPELYGQPLTHMIFVDGQIPEKLFAEINKGLDVHQIRTGCRICWGTGLASVIIGLIEIDNIPQKLKKTVCWCRR
jgi:hypothetical protein